jgi:hypothetical protein
MTPPSGFQKPALRFRYWRFTSMSHSARRMTRPLRTGPGASRRPGRRLAPKRVTEGPISPSRSLGRSWVAAYLSGYRYTWPNVRIRATVRRPRAADMGAKQPVLSTEEEWRPCLKPDLGQPAPNVAIGSHCSPIDAAERHALVHRPRAILIRRPAACPTAAIRRSAGAQLATSRSDCRNPKSSQNWVSSLAVATGTP